MNHPARSLHGFGRVWVPATRTFRRCVPLTLVALASRAQADAILLQASGVSGAQTRSVKVLIAAGLLIVVVLALGLIILQMRRTLFKSGAEDAGPGLLLDDLREMKRRGEISEQEFERMKAKIAAQLSSAMTRAPASSSKPMPPTERTRRSAQPGVPGDAGPEKRARPGYDLTGEKLPDPNDGA